mmetsp:Transcript_27292/g.92902  ORF Transcript_27292/g.92902 Transcript_27292/m.92902 type:complete len:201 (+) Transcript_27292:635-1237(+)
MGRPVGHLLQRLLAVVGVRRREGEFAALGHGELAQNGARRRRDDQDALVVVLRERDDRAARGVDEAAQPVDVVLEARVRAEARPFRQIRRDGAEAVAGDARVDRTRGGILREAAVHVGLAVARAVRGEAGRLLPVPGEDHVALARRRLDVLADELGELADLGLELDEPRAVDAGAVARGNGRAAGDDGEGRRWDAARGLG